MTGDGVRLMYDVRRTNQNESSQDRNNENNQDDNAKEDIHGKLISEDSTVNLLVVRVLTHQPILLLLKKSKATQRYIQFENPLQISRTPLLLALAYTRRLMKYLAFRILQLLSCTVLGFAFLTSSSSHAVTETVPTHLKMAATLEPGMNICDLPGDPSLILTTNVDLGDKKLEIMKGM